MKTKTSRTKAFNSKLAAYSATATAALLVAPAADATIQNITTFSYDGGDTFVTTPPSASAHNGSVFVRFTGGVFKGSIYNKNSSGFADARVLGSFAGGYPFASRLNPGDLVAGRNFYYGFHFIANADSDSGGPSFKQFVPAANGAKTGYVAFKASNTHSTYYGWLHVKVTADGNDKPNNISLVDKDGNGIYGAFENAGDPGISDFKAGDIASPVPEPSIAAIGGLGLLALGAVGVREMRRRRKA